MKHNSSHRPFSPGRLPFFYGWPILVAGTLGVLMSIPGQTVGVSVFTDYLLEALKLSRDQLSFAYMAGTIASSLLLPWAGKLYDRLGARITAAGAGFCLALVLALLTRSDILADHLLRIPWIGPAAGSLLVILPGFFALRLFGQGILTLASRNMIAKWFDRRRGLVFGMTGVFTALGFSSAPLVFELAINNLGWRGAWTAMAVIIGAGFVPFVLVFFRDNPEECGLFPDGKEPAFDTGSANGGESEISATLPEARRTPTFWVFSLSFALSALYTTGFTFHVVSAFASSGMAREEAISIFLPASIIAVVVHLSGGWLSDRIDLKILLAIMLAGMIISMAGLVILAPGLPVLMVIFGNGLSMGLFSLLSGVSWPKIFGRKHLGAISGLNMSIVVFHSAVGPVLFSQSLSWTGSYSAAGIANLAAAGLLLAAAFFLKTGGRAD